MSVCGERANNRNNVAQRINLNIRQLFGCGMLSRPKFLENSFACIRSMCGMLKAISPLSLRVRLFIFP